MMINPNYNKKLPDSRNLSIIITDYYIKKKNIAFSPKSHDN